MEIELREETEKGEKRIEDLWNKIKNKIKEMMIRKKKKIWKMELGHKDWWNKECII